MTHQVENIPFALQSPVVLIGLMGAGKSAVGRRLAERLGVLLVDVDAYIEEQQGCTISQIFSYAGEAAFRKIEQAAIKTLVTENAPQVIATGGGAFLQEPNREAIQKHAVSVWLNASVDTLYERVRYSTHRPLLAEGDKRSILQKLADERYPVYALADITVQVDHNVLEQAVTDIIEALEQHGAANATG